MASHLIRLLALAIGISFVLEVLPSSLNIMVRAIQKTPWEPIVLGLGLLPILIACILAYFFFRYAATIDSGTENLDESILYAGLKLCGLYLFVQGISRLFVGVGFTLRSDATQDSGFLYLAYAAVYFTLSYILIKRTCWLSKILGFRDSENSK